MFYAQYPEWLCRVWLVKPKKGRPLVPCFIDGKSFASKDEAAAYFGVNRSTILRRLKRGII